MGVMRLFFLWLMLSTSGNVFTFSVYGSVVRCSIPAVMEGHPTSLTCYFNSDLYERKKSFVVQHVNQHGDLKVILSCTWSSRERPECDSAANYIFSGEFSSTVSLTIPSAAENHVGSYMCLKVGANPKDAVPCNFTLKEQTSPSPPMYSVPTTEQKSITTDNQQEDNNVTVIAIVIPVVLIIVLISAVIIIYVYRSRISARLRNCKIRKQTARRSPDERENEGHVESRPLVPITSPRVFNTETTENAGRNTQTELSQVETIAAEFFELTQEEVITKFGKYIYNRAVQLLLKTGAVVITGPERCGKSTLGRAVLDHFSEKGYYPLVLNHPNRWSEEKQGNRKHVVLLDECKVDEWSTETVQSMLRDDQCSVIFVLRSDVLNSECSAVLCTTPTVVLGKKVPADIESTKQLFEACQSDDVEQVVTLLSGGLDPNWRDDEDKRPLHIACEHGQADIVSNLLWAGSSVDVCDTSGRTPLHYACGATSQSSRSVQHDSSKTGSVQARGATRITTHDNDEQYHSPRERIVKSLLAYGADVNGKDKNGLTPLHVACKRNHRNITKRLTGAKSYVETRDNNGLTSLHWACMMKAKDSADVLLRANASVQAKTDAGRTPLHLACESGSIEIVQMLLDKGAKIEAKDNHDDTPTSLANRKEHYRILAMLSQS